MAITIKDINLQKFIEKVSPQSFPEPGKLVIPDVDWLKIVSMLKLDFTIQRLLRK